MITSRAPLRLSLGGGGTDLPSFYKKHGGYLIAGSIDKYIYTTIIKPFEKGIYLKYSKTEKINKISEIKHNIIRTILKKEFNNNCQIEITTIADIPSGTGLGSSGSFCVGLSLAIKNFNNEIIEKKQLAEYASKIEINDLKLPVGKQDQYISSFGGISEFYFNRDGSVEINRLPINDTMRDDMNDNMIMFFTGFSRKASKFLQDQNKKTLSVDKNMIENLKLTKNLGFKSREALIKGNLDNYGKIMHEHWLHKLKRSKTISNNKINELYNSALKNGAIGGKLVGAGGGGFLLFVAHDKKKLLKKMNEFGLIHTKFNFENEGAKIINQ